jgi:hypothetical protein
VDESRGRSIQAYRLEPALREGPSRREHDPAV